MTPYETIERLIDRFGVQDVLIMISDVCNEKAAHIQSSWQDDTLACQWNKAGNAVRGAVKKLPRVRKGIGIR